MTTKRGAVSAPPTTTLEIRVGATQSMHRPPTSVCATLVNWQKAMSVLKTTMGEMEIATTPRETVLTVSTTCTFFTFDFGPILDDR